MSVNVIVAMAENGVIGRGGDLPWRLPADLKRFKALTTGHTLIAGRKTFDSIGRALPHRRNIVLTRNLSFAPPPGIELAASLPQALEMAQRDAEIFIIGGAAIYQLALPLAHRLYLTIVHAQIDGDVYMPPIDWTAWHLVEEESRETDAKHEHAFSFRTYTRVVRAPDR